MAQFVFKDFQRPVGQTSPKYDNLRILKEKGYQVPATHFISPAVYTDTEDTYVQSFETIRADLEKILVDGRSYAVRSAATLEDGGEHTFAGQFKTVLNVQDLDGLRMALEEVWRSTRSETVRVYISKHQLDPQSIRMGVLVQEMVKPVVSGVVFSKNPITALDEVLVEAVEGPGTQLVQDGITPHRWVYKWGSWLSQPEQPILPLEIMQQIVKAAQKIEKEYGKPADLEWVFDGDQVFWVQLRPIQALSGVNLYSNKISREVLPGMIKPLVWSTNVPIINGEWVRLFTEILGPNDIDPMALARSFHYRAYFNMGIIGQIMTLFGMPRETLELLLSPPDGAEDRPRFRPGPRTLRLLPRMLWFARDKWTIGPRFEKFYKETRPAFSRFDVDLSALSEQELWQRISQLISLIRSTAYYSVILPILMEIFNTILKGQVEDAGVDFADFDLNEGMEAEFAPYDPNHAVRGLAVAFAGLSEAERQAVEADQAESIESTPALALWLERSAAFTRQFGHLSDSGNDFSVPNWREDPKLPLRFARNYHPPSTNPRKKIRFQELIVFGFRRWFIGLFYRRARQFRLYREVVSSLYTYGYGLLRPHFLALGTVFSRRGLLRDSNQIFYLTYNELESLVSGQSLDINPETLTVQRQAEMAASENVVLPEIIFGDDVLPLAPSFAPKLRGVPTSRGRFTGRVCVVMGINDFDKMTPGAVLVIPFSDVGWTPLFVKAGAVIAEGGGMLSHSSIIAREYHIPAVVSVNGACSLADGQLVTVDGFTGEIVIHKEEAQ